MRADSAAADGGDVAPRRRLPAKKLSEIEARALDARRQAEEIAASLYDTPTVLDLATGLGFAVVEQPNFSDEDGDRLAGMLMPSDLGGVIYCEAYDPAFRQRFSIAHELGHAVLHETSRRSGVRMCAQGRVDPTDEALGGRDQEEEANAFAAAFLMPAEQFRAAITEYGYCDGFLAQRFGVSLAAVRRRWETLRSLD